MYPIAICLFVWFRQHLPSIKPPDFMQNAKTSFDPSVSESQNFGWQNLGFPFILIREANQPRLKMFSKSR
jgi:hypothetical protein